MDILKINGDDDDDDDDDEAWLQLPVLPMYKTLIITLFCYNTDFRVH